jgi:hypothetical protein
MLAEDTRYFLHQSLSSPCLNGFTGCGKKAPLLSLALATEDGWPISRWFFARCGIPLLFPSNSRFARWHLAVNLGGIPHLAKNQRDMGHPSSVANARESPGTKKAAARQALPFKELVFPHPLKRLLVAIVLRRPDASTADSEAEQIMYAALIKGLSFKVTMSSILTLTPPLTIEERHLTDAVHILGRCFTKLKTTLSSFSAASPWARLQRDQKTLRHTAPTRSSELAWPLNAACAALLTC